MGRPPFAMNRRYVRWQTVARLHVAQTADIE